MVPACWSLSRYHCLRWPDSYYGPSRPGNPRADRRVQHSILDVGRAKETHGDRDQTCRIASGADGKIDLACEVRFLEIWQHLCMLTERVRLLPSDRKSAIGIVKLERGQGQLLEVVDALRPSSRLARRLNCRLQQRDLDAVDGDHN